MLLNYLFSDKMEGIEFAFRKEMFIFLPVFAPIDVEDEFVFAKDVIWVERAGGFLALLVLSEHKYQSNYKFDCLQIITFTIFCI